MNVSAHRATVSAPLLREQAAAATAEGRWFSSARAVLAASLLASPFAFGAVQAWAWAALYILSFLALAMWAMGCVRRGFVKIAWTPLYWPAALFLALGAVQYFAGLGETSYGAREALIKLLTDIIFFFLAGQLFADCSSRTWRAFGLGVTAYAFLMALFAILQFFSGHGLIYWVVSVPGSAFGPYVNHNDYAGLMEMLVPLSAAFVISQPRDEQHDTLLGFAVAVAAGSLLLSASRGGFVSLLAEIVIFAAILWKRSPKHKPRNTLLMGTLGVIAAASLFFWMAPQSVSDRLGTVANVVHAPEATYGDRMHVAYDALRIFAAHPVLGTGLGSFGSVFPGYQTFPTDQTYPYAHNDYAQALAETGAVGAVIILWALALFFRSAFKDLPDRLESEAGWMQLGAAIGVCGLLVHSFVDFNLHIPANAAWFAVCVALSTIQFGEGHKATADA
jgi:O-antigen ligase